MTRRTKRAAWTIACVMALGFLYVASQALFPETYKTDYRRMLVESTRADTLRSECALVISNMAKTNYVLVFPTNLPPLLASLKPQSITLPDEDGFVDVQMSGGFNHRGLLVSMDRASPKTPNHTWLRGRVAQGIFEYRE